MIDPAADISVYLDGSSEWLQPEELAVPEDMSHHVSPDVSLSDESEYEDDRDDEERSAEPSASLTIDDDSMITERHEEEEKTEDQSTATGGFDSQSDTDTDIGTELTRENTEVEEPRIVELPIAENEDSGFKRRFPEKGF